jgi:hypothetical protein
VAEALDIPSLPPAIDRDVKTRYNVARDYEEGGTTMEMPSVTPAMWAANLEARKEMEPDCSKCGRTVLVRKFHDLAYHA